MSVAAQKELAASDGGRGADWFGQAIQCEEPRRLAAADDDRRSIEIGNVDPTSGGDRGGIDRSNPSQPERTRAVLASFGIDARENSLIVRQKVEAAVVEQRGGNVGRAANSAPGDSVRTGNVPRRAIETYREQGPLVVAAADEDHSVGGHRR